MPLPVAHGLLGATVVGALQSSEVFKRNWKELLLGACLGVCPDFDYFLNYIPGSGGGWHHGFTHSFVFAFLLGALASGLTGRWKLKELMMFSLATLSHPLLDFFFTESRGIELFWPFSYWRFKLLIPSPIDYSWRTTSLSATALDLVKISLKELIIFAPVVSVVLWLKRPNGGSQISRMFNVFN
jgi:membrane-bound metal-dependent hydrolase YbcI (DUF457 family)